MERGKFSRGLAKSIVCIAIGASAISRAAAKSHQQIVPTYILKAHTVAVVVDPEASVSLDNPLANDTALKDVETAINNWGRFTTVSAARQADIVIVLRKGNMKAVNETMPSPRPNSGPGVFSPANSGTGAGTQRGQQPGFPDDASNGVNTPRGTSPQLEVGNTDDSFMVYMGAVDHPLDGVAGWRWVRKDALHPHDVPAVTEFRKAIEDAEKQAAKQHP